MKLTKAADKPAAKPAAAESPRTTPARVLVKCQHGDVDDVVQLDDVELGNALSAGQVDPHPDAVAYAASLK